MYITDSRKYQEYKQIVERAILTLDKQVTAYHGTSLAFKYQQQRHNLIENKYQLIAKLIKGEVKL